MGVDKNKKSLCHYDFRKSLHYHCCLFPKLQKQMKGPTLLLRNGKIPLKILKAGSSELDVSMPILPEVEKEKIFSQMLKAILSLTFALKKCQVENEIDMLFRY